MSCPGHAIWQLARPRARPDLLPSMSKVALIAAPAVASHEVAAHLGPVVRVVFYRLVPAAAIILLAKGMGDMQALTNSNGDMRALTNRIGRHANCNVKCGARTIYASHGKMCKQSCYTATALNVVAWPNMDTSAASQHTRYCSGTEQRHI